MGEGLKRLYQSFGIIFFYGMLGIAQEKITKADYGEEKVKYFRVFCIVLLCCHTQHCVLRGWKLLKKFFKLGSCKNRRIFGKKQKFKWPYFRLHNAYALCFW